MNEHWRRVVAAVVAELVGMGAGAGAARAQSNTPPSNDVFDVRVVPTPRELPPMDPTGKKTRPRNLLDVRLVPTPGDRGREAGERLIAIKGFYINPDRINFLEIFGGGDKPESSQVYFSGLDRAVVLNAEKTAQLLKALGKSAADLPAEAKPGAVEVEIKVTESGKVEPKEKDKDKSDPLAEPAPSRFLAHDGFDGKLVLNWKPVREDPSHVSLTKKPGALTITTQRGSIHGDEKKDEFGEGVQAKNLYLIDNPLAKDVDFVVTTCVSGFCPETSYQQAGLIVYDDDDNYLKWGYEYDWPRGGGQAFCLVAEADAKPSHNYGEPEPGLKRYWLRLTKRGNRYVSEASTDGKTFRPRGEVSWGDGAPKRLGVVAKNGGAKEAGELDAAFEFFELRAEVPDAPRPR